MQIEINKCFLLTPKKIMAQIVFKKNEKAAPLIPKNDVIEPKDRKLGSLITS